MKKIYKYKLFIPGSSEFTHGTKRELTFPSAPKILDVQAQLEYDAHGRVRWQTIVLWAEVDIHGPRPANRTFVMYWTGMEIPDVPQTYIGTVQVMDRMVCHIYELH